MTITFNSKCSKAEKNKRLHFEISNDRLFFVFQEDLSVCHTHHVMDDRGETLAVTKTCATPQTCFSQVGCRRDKSTNQTVHGERETKVLSDFVLFASFRQDGDCVYTCTLTLLFLFLFLFILREASEI